HVQASLRTAFGDQIFSSQGEIDRGKLARIVFGSHADAMESRRKLEEIVHPEIGRQVKSQIESAKTSGRDCVLLDAAILLEAGWRELCDLVVFIDASDAVRLSRVQQRSGWTAAQLQQRESSQLSLIDKRRQADVVISNNFELESAGKELFVFLQNRGLLSCKLPQDS
ncbi:MAG: dephospho-CoA kinase, partial [Planctomycetes bacterium]|nr:dephospho-CoA kinase [Planctomycetota bacterium]